MTAHGRPRPRWSLWIAAPLLAALLAGCGGHVLPEIRSDEDRLDAARRLMDASAYGDAVELLKSYLDASAGAARIDEAVYLLGDCYLQQREWAFAALEYERVLRDYPESDSAASAAFRVGEAYFGQARAEDFDQEFTVRAIDQWNQYLRANPGHWRNAEAERHVHKARVRLARKTLGTGQLYVQLRHLEPARIYFRRVIDEYGDTTVRPEAELGLAMTDALDGKRAEAIEQLRAIETRYPQLPVAQQAARERRRLERR